MKKIYLFLSLVVYCALSFGQATPESNLYIWPKDTLVLQKLHKWQGKKFGLLMHWGTYSEWGIVESWSICPEDWVQRKGPYAANYFDYVKAYENLQTKFNPIDFNPDKWAAAAKDAGMKYVVFTTKHHDGFCMFDTKFTDYKVTSPKTPFSKNPKANIAKEVFNSFRKDGFMIGAYFSKPDWHSPDYWWPYFPPKDHNVNYDPAKYPERWSDFKGFVYNQIQELMTGYGRVDILWLDGGWVKPQKPDPDHGIYDQNINMPSIVKMARKDQPGLLVIDRGVFGKYENYQTPEQTVPDKPLNIPWESCITMGTTWSYSPHDHYKSANKLVHMLIKIVSRGGNFLLNIGPNGQGDWSDSAYSRLKEIGSWMHVYSSAIYDSKPLAPYENGNVVYTQSEDGRSKYIFILSDENNATVNLPEKVKVAAGLINPDNKISVMGINKKVKYNKTTDELVFSKSIQQKVFGKYAVVVKVD